MHDERDAIQASPDKLPVIDTRSLTSVLPQRVVRTHTTARLKPIPVGPAEWMEGIGNPKKPPISEIK